jgi:hypothetical protein
MKVTIKVHDVKIIKELNGVKIVQLDIEALQRDDVIIAIVKAQKRENKNDTQNNII